MLWRTAFGLRLRSCGESPVAAETLGVNVYRYKFLAVLISGGLAGLGGASSSSSPRNLYREGQTGGRGFIGLAAMIFGNWRPGGLAGGAALFGYTDAVQLRGGGDAVHASCCCSPSCWSRGASGRSCRRRGASPARRSPSWCVVAALVWFLRHRRASPASSPA